MIHLHWPWAFLLLPLPLLVRWVLTAASDKTSAGLRVPFFSLLNKGQGLGLNTLRWPWLLAIVIWILLLCAFSRPQWLSDPVAKIKTGRDMMLAIDLSSSMEIKDFFLQQQPVDRLVAVKSVVHDFIKKRRGDRIGLIVFGTHAYVQSPLSYDLRSVRTLLDETRIGMIGKQTAIGDAIGLAVKRLHDHPKNRRILILLSDGNNTAGIISAEHAAHFAALDGLRVYTIGIGQSRQMMFPGQTIDQAAILNEGTLKAVAKLSGGRYFRAQNTDELKEIYRTIDQMEKIPIGAEYFHHVIEFYQWPLALALFLSFVFAALKCEFFVLRSQNKNQSFHNLGEF